MKKYYILSFFLITVQVGTAQFSVDPTAPFAVCAASSQQDNVKSIDDGTGGYFVFWLDRRSDGTTKHIYGQHLDAVGIPQWTANGKAIVAQPGKSVAGFACMLYDGGILVTWITNSASSYGDSLVTKKIDFNGNDVWAGPVTVATNAGTIGLTPYAFNTFPNDSGAYITYTIIYFGGSSAFLFNRIDFNGAVRWADNSKSFTLAGYDYRSCWDGDNGIYAVSKGNGMGSTINVMHFDQQGNPTWPQSVDFTNGGGPLGFAGNLNLMNDEESNFYCVWDGNNGKILAAKVDSSGTIAWQSNPKQVADISSYQYYCHARISGGKLYACWNDDRNAGQLSLYVQRLDTSGAQEWSADGIIAGIENTYSHPQIAFSDSNSIVVAFSGTGNQDLMVQRVLADSSLSWDNNGRLVGSISGTALSGETSFMDNPEGCNAIFWGTSSGDVNIFGAKICSDGHLINVPGQGSVLSGLTLYPNPATGLINIGNKTIVPGTPVEISVFDPLGSKVLSITRVAGIAMAVDVRSLQQGIYFISVQAGEKYFHAGFVKAEVQ